MREQRDRSRAVAQGGVRRSDDDLAKLPSEFIGYPNETQADGLSVRAVRQPNDGTSPALVVLDRTPFYAEGGGQVGDRGELIGQRGRLQVDDTQRMGNAIVHIGHARGRYAAG